MMKWMIVLLFFTGNLLAETPTEKGMAIAKKMAAFNDGYKGESSETEMILIDASGNKVSRKMKSKIMEVVGDGDKSLIEFLSPADVRGTKMLTWSHKDKDDDQWIYLPAFKRVKRITSRAKTGSFMGSEFSYEDLGSQEIEKYTYKYVRDEVIEGEKCWVLERYPKAKGSGYSKQVAWVGQKYFLAVKTEYYDRRKKLLKTAVVSGVKKIKKWWRVDQLTMTNHQSGKKSIIKWTKRKVGESLANRSFHKKGLVK